MIKILRSLMVLGLVAAVGVTVSRSGAWFTDQEQVLGNSLDTGTIDIAVDGTNPWTRQFSYQIKDLKPSQNDYIDFVVQNVGSNPVNLFKTLGHYVETELRQSEPKCLALNGTWTPGTGANGGTCNLSNTVTNLDTQINYDLKVDLYNVDPVANPTTPSVWHENIYYDTDNVKLDALENKGMYLGMIPAGWWLKVKQSYHMPSTTTNEYQGEKLTFDMTLDAEQLGKTALRLENKQDVNGESHTLNLDGTYADLSYTVRDREFKYDLTVRGQVDGAYTLVAWVDPTNLWNWGSGPTVTALANVNVSGGNGDVVGGLVELNKNLLNAKVWLVKGTQAPGSTYVLGWPLPDALYETGLMDYYDADL